MAKILAPTCTKSSTSVLRAIKQAAWQKLSQFKYGVDIGLSLWYRVGIGLMWGSGFQAYDLDFRASSCLFNYTEM